MDMDVRGAEEFAELAQRIKVHADAKALRKELYAGLNRSTKGIRDDMKNSIAPALPTSGGLAARVASSARLSTRSASSGRNIGVRIVAGAKGGNLSAMNRGRFRHPVFGAGPWVEQTEGVRAGFLNQPFLQKAAEVQRDVAKVMDEIARKVAG